MASLTNPLLEALTKGLAPFTRLTQPYIFNVGTTAQNFTVDVPAEAMTFRLVNRCNCDVRIMKATSMTDLVTDTTGTVFLARSDATMTTQRPTIVSLKTCGDNAGTGVVELYYGFGF